MVNSQTEKKLFDEFNSVCNELTNYEHFNKLMREKIELTYKVLNTKYFKENLYKWGIEKPEELIAVYEACKSEDGFIATYGSSILGGLYLDFCQLFISMKETYNKQGYKITNLKNSKSLTVEIKQLAEYYSSIVNTNFNINIDVNIELECITIPIIYNDFVSSSDNSTKYGILKVDRLIKQQLTDILEELFDIKAVKNISRDADNSNSDNKVVQLFIPSSEASNFK